MSMRAASPASPAAKVIRVAGEPPAFERLLGQLAHARAATLARAGCYAQARAALAAGSSEESVERLDLTARIAAQQGQKEEARSQWQRVLALEPEHAGALAGLEWISGQRPSPRKGWLYPILLSLGMVAGLSLAFGALQRQTMEAQASLSRRLEESEERLTQRLTALANRPSTVVPAPPSPAQQEGPSLLTQMRAALDDGSLAVHPSGDGLIVAIPNGLFRRGTVFRPDAKDQLVALAARLEPFVAAVRIEVLGSTDARPLPEGHRLQDNQVLALQRAVAAGRQLAPALHLPLSALSFGVSPAGANGLAPNDVRNRTAVLRIRSARPVD